MAIDAHTDQLRAVAFLDKYGRFAKATEDVAIVRLFYVPEYRTTPVDLTVPEFDSLDVATRTAIRNAGSAAGLVETDGISNA